MKKLMLITAIAFFVATPALAATPVEYKVPPATPEEQAIGKVFETLTSLQQARDIKKLVEFYAEDAVVKYLYGARNEPHEAKGRQQIYAAFSSSQIQKVEVRDLGITVNGETAEVTGRVLATLRSSARDFLKENKSIYRLIRSKDGQWQISYQETVSSSLLAQ